MDLKKILSDNMPILLTSTAVVGVVSTTVMAVRGTPPALRDIWDAETELGRKTTVMEKIQLGWRHYLPAVAIGGTTIGAIIGAQTINTKRQAALVGLYSMTDKAFTEYKHKIVEKLGEGPEREAREEIVRDHVEESSKSGEVIITGRGDHLCYDDLSGRLFRSDIEKVRKAVNDINAKCISEMYASLNDFYREIGLPPNALGEELGWRFDYLLDISFTSHLTEDGDPALCLTYNVEPIRGYYKINDR